MGCLRQVIKVVAPKRAALAEAEAAYAVVMVSLRAKQYELQVGQLQARALHLMTCLCVPASATEMVTVGWHFGKHETWLACLMLALSTYLCRSGYSL